MRCRADLLGYLNDDRSVGSRSAEMNRSIKWQILILAPSVGLGLGLVAGVCGVKLKEIKIRNKMKKAGRLLALHILVSLSTDDQA